MKKRSASYNVAYETAIQRIQEQSADRKELAQRVLAWVVRAKRNLQVSELQTALGVEVEKCELDLESCPDFDMMVSACAGLVTIDESAATIRLVHYTAQTFFDNEKSRLFPLAETDMTKICTAFLSLERFAESQCDMVYGMDSSSENEEDGSTTAGSFLRLNPGFGFYTYAACYWGVHAHEAPGTH